VIHTFGHKKLVELLDLLHEGKITQVNGKLVMQKIASGDERMPQ
jgi:hypothetical protein